jgi:Leucine-rich repeat (LRR) protein
MDVGAFNGLTKLSNLSLHYNPIIEIKPGTFETLSSLKSLELFANQLEHLDNDTFRGLFNLNFINLGSNKLQSLYPGTFSGLPNIRFIKLIDNPSLRIPTDGPFIQSQSLTHLDISLCDIISLSGETFANLPALEWIDVRFNQLRTVDVSIFTALPKLNLMLMYPNPIRCDCKLKELVQKCKDIAIWPGDVEVRLNCDTECEEVGKWVSDLQGLSEGKCSITIYSNINSLHFSHYEINYVIGYMDSVKQQHGSISSFLKYYQLPVYAIPFTFGTTCNVIILIIIICNKDMRTVPNIYIIKPIITIITTMSAEKIVSIKFTF